VGVSTDGEGEASRYDRDDFLDCGVLVEVEGSKLLLFSSIDGVDLFLFRFFFLILPGSAGANINPMSPSIGSSCRPKLAPSYP
jgi:hypothetical protein